MQIQDILNRLDGVKENGTNQWQAHCPYKQGHAHGDKHHSLSISLNGTKILLPHGMHDGKYMRRNRD